jgi:quinol monooxygenase YgiN
VKTWFRLGFIIVALSAVGAVPAVAQNPAPAPAPAPAAAATLVVTYLEVDPAGVDKAIPILSRYAAQGRKADANTGFNALRERDRPGRFAMIESWRDPAALAAHAAAAKAFVDELQSYLTSPPDSRPSIGLDIGPNTAHGPGAGGAVVVVLTHVDVIPSGKDQAVELVKALAAASRKENGNMLFDVLQQANRANHMTLVEVWRDGAAFDAYVAAAPTRDFRAKLAPHAGALYDERLYQLIE